MKTYTIFISAFMLLLSSCTIYTEKQSEAISQTVYATKDSLDKARLDLADRYSEETTRLIKPPKKRISIESVYKKTIDVIASQNKNTPIIANKQRVLIIPEKYKTDTVVVVSSKEYEELLKEKEIFLQLQKDYDNLSDTKKLVDDELIKQMEYRDKMIQDLNIMQKKLVEKDLAILQRNIIIVLLLGTIIGATYLRIKGIL
jgi:hypothetical protein